MLYINTLAKDYLNAYFMNLTTNVKNPTTKYMTFRQKPLRHICLHPLNLEIVIIQ